MQISCIRTIAVINIWKIEIVKQLKCLKKIGQKNKIQGNGFIFNFQPKYFPYDQWNYQSYNLLLEYVLTLSTISYLNLLAIFEFIYGPSIKYFWNWGERDPSKMCTVAYKGRGASRLMCTYALTLLSIFMFLAACLSYDIFYYL